MEKELYDIKNGIIDKIILITAIASLPVNIASLLPYYEIGCQNICFFHVSLPVFFFGLLALKNKLNFYLKTHSLSVVFFVDWNIRENLFWFCWSILLQLSSHFTFRHFVKEKTSNYLSSFCYWFTSVSGDFKWFWLSLSKG